MRRHFSGADTGGVDVRAEINVTSLVDVAFTLLIIFMITAPILQGGIEVEVPEAAAGPLSADDAVVITIDTDGQIYLDDVPVTFEELDATIDRAFSDSESDQIFLKADGNVLWELPVRVMGRLHDAGAAVSIITNPEDRRRSP